MKKMLFLLFVSFLSGRVQAQKTDSVQAWKNKIYVGLGVNGRYYLVDYNQPNRYPENSDYFLEKGHVYVGYNLTKRIQLETGLGIGNVRRHSNATYFGFGGEIIDYHHYGHTKALLIPIKINHKFIIRKRITIYGTGTIIPAFSNTELKKTEVQNQITTTTFRAKGSGYNTFLSVGLGINFKIWKKFSGYTEVNALNRNLSTGTVIDPFWQQRINKPLKYLSYGLGVYYNL